MFRYFFFATALTMFVFVVNVVGATAAPNILEKVKSRMAGRVMQEHTIAVNGVERRFLVFKKIIGGLKPRPLVITMHGGENSPEKISDITKFNILAAKENFIVVYPEGVNHHWNDGRKYKIKATDNADDLGFISALIDYAVGNFNADPKRIYITGASNGGTMTYLLGCKLTDKIAAIAPVIANMPEAVVDVCQPSRPLPVSIMNGTKDPIMPWGGGEITAKGEKRGKVISAARTQDFWAANNNCPEMIETTDFPDIVPEDESTVRLESFKECRDGTNVRLYVVENGGHTWPGPGTVGRLVKRMFGNKNNDMNATEEIWNFFSQHSL